MSILLWSTVKSYMCPFNLVFFSMLSTVKSLEISPKSFFLLSTCVEELLLTPIITFLPHSPLDYENCDIASNPIL